MLDYHTGELEVQALAGLPPRASRVNKSLRPTLPLIAQDFLHEQRMIVLGAADGVGRVWTSILAGPAGFVYAPDERTVVINAAIAPFDPLFGQLRNGVSIGTLTIDFATRRRMRVNGRIAQMYNPIVLHTEQVYSNCPKYIQMRNVSTRKIAQSLESNAEVVPGASPSDNLLHPFNVKQPVQRDVLTVEQHRWIETADTFFIASAHHEGGTDVSHRGGNPGFVQVEDAHRLIFPDYSGNRMFQTLGNIQAEPRAGLLFLDFESGNTLQLTGEARIIWDTERIANVVGAERLIEFTIAEIVETRNALSLHWQFVEYSPALPRA